MHGQALDHGSLVRVFRRDDQHGLAPTASLESDGQDTLDRAHRSIQSEFAGNAAIGQAWQVPPLHDGQHAERNGEVEAGTLLFDVGGGQIDRGAPARPTVTAVRHGGGHPVFALLHRSVGQPDNNDFGIAASLVDLDLHLPRVSTVEGGGIDLGQHGRMFARERQDGSRKWPGTARLATDGSGREPAGLYPAHSLRK